MINKNVYIAKRGLRFKGVRSGSDSMNDSDVSKIFAEAGKYYGFDEVQAEFSAYRDFKLNWTRSYKWISFEVSDYLSDAPENVIASFADSIFRRIRGEGDADYSEEVRDWLASEQFVKEKQPVFLRRYRGLSTEGQVRNLLDSYDRLVSAGLVERDPQMALRWSDLRNRSTTRSSVLMKVVVVNSVLDNEEVPEDVLDFALYSAVKRIEAGFMPKDPKTDLSEFPEHDRIEQYIWTRGWSL